MKNFYAVFDTNVLVSALMSRRKDSPTVALLDFVLEVSDCGDEGKFFPIRKSWDKR